MHNLIRMRGPVFFCDVTSLQIIQRKILFRIAVHSPEEQKVKKTHDTGDGETPTPADVNQDNADERDADGRSKFRSGIEDGCGEAAFLLRKPVANSLCVRGKCGRFSHSEREPGSK